MRPVSAEWGSLNAATTRERRFYFRIETDPDDPTLDVYIRSHDDILIGANESGLVPGQIWTFDGTAAGWNAVNATATTGTYLVLEPTAADPRFQSPTGLTINGANNTIIRARIRRIDGSAWGNGSSTVYYETSGHGFSASYLKHSDSPNPPVDEWVTVEWDMTDLDAGGTDWTDSTITRIRLDMGADVGDDFEVQWVSVGSVYTSTLLAKPKTQPKIRTQTLNPDEGRSTIGTMSFDAIDVGGTLTDEMRDSLLDRDIGWRQKRVEYYSGFKQLRADQYELEDTQLIDRVVYSQGVYQFRCRDIQREARKRIFEPLVARLAQPVAEDDTTIEIFFNPGFAAVEHGTSYSDGPSASYLYVKIDDEIIRVPAAGIGATQLTTVTRGVLGTRAAAHTTDETAQAQRGKEVTEVIYLELPVPKLVYALLTGVLLGQSGTLPAHWHLGIAAGPFVKTSEFQNIGSDLYVQSDDTLGMLERYILDGPEDGKTFIEKQILRKYGLYMPIHANGEIGLRRGQPVLSGSATVGVIDDSLLVDDVTLTYAMDKVINEIRIGWNEVSGEPTRFLEIIDTESRDRWEPAPPVEVVARGLVGSRQTESRVRDIFEGLRDRYSGPPLICDVEVFGSQSLYEVGDVIRLRTSRVRDFTNSETALLDRAFEIQGVAKNLSSGTVTYSLFGSSQRAGALPPLESEAALPDAWYTSTGTNIATMTDVVDSGTELVLPDGITFTGASTVGAAIYYATKDVRLPSSMTANYTQNVQLRIRGVLQIDGEFSGVGAGIAGVPDTASTSGIPQIDALAGPVPFATQAGTPGYFGTTQADGGLIERVRQKTGSDSRYRIKLQSVPATITQGQVEAIPSLNLIWDDPDILGLPTDLRGTSGGPGGLRYFNDSRGDETNVNIGGAGGAGGAGLLIVSRGMVFGASGRIRSSGAAGASGVRNAGDIRPAWSGGGAGGAPGATIIILDGANSPSPVLTGGTIIADYGATPAPGTPSNRLSSAWIEHDNTRFDDPEVKGAFVLKDRVSFFQSAASGRKAGIAAARFFFLLPDVEATPDRTDLDIAGEQVITLAVTEAYDQRDDARVTLMLATVTQVSTTAAYSHANIYVRGVTGDLYPVWTLLGPAEPTLQFELPADGETYEFRAVPVLINGVEADIGDTDSAIVTDSLQVSAAPNALTVENLPRSVSMRVVIPNTAGKPDTVDIWRTTNIAHTQSSATKIGNAPTFYVLADDEFVADYLDGSVTPGTTYYYFATAINEHGASTAFPASAPGVTGAPTASAPTTVTATGTNSPPALTAGATIVRGGAQSTIIVDAQIDNANAVSLGATPFPVTLTLRRGGSGGTTIATWTLSGFHSQVASPGQDIVYGHGNFTHIDTDTGTGSTEYHVTLATNNNNYNEYLSVTATQTYFS